VTPLRESGPRSSESVCSNSPTKIWNSNAEITLQDQKLFLADIETVDAEPDGHRSLVRRRNGLIIGGITGAAIVAALATVRYRRHHRK
jgi:hypothetical protein